MKTFLVFFSSLLCFPAWSQTPLGVNFRWHISHHCSNTSPLIKLKNIPPGTTHLVVNMVDLDNKNHDHGGATLVRPEGFPAEYDIAAGGSINIPGRVLRISQPWAMNTNSTYQR